MILILIFRILIFVSLGMSIAILLMCGDDERWWDGHDLLWRGSRRRPQHHQCCWVGGSHVPHLQQVVPPLPLPYDSSFSVIFTFSLFSPTFFCLSPLINLPLYFPSPYLPVVFLSLSSNLMSLALSSPPSSCPSPPPCSPHLDQHISRAKHSPTPSA